MLMYLDFASRNWALGYESSAWHTFKGDSCDINETDLQLREYRGMYPDAGKKSLPK
jgi:hypothetical protein